MLVVEDSIGVRELQRVILEGAGYDVVTAVDGSDGAARLTGDPVDLVLSDVEMPGMDGFTLTRTIRRTRGWENVPVVIMTSRGDEADKRAGLDAGANAYLLKSEFDQTQLVDTVRRLVGPLSSPPKPAEGHHGVRERTLDAHGGDCRRQPYPAPDRFRRSWSARGTPSCRVRTASRLFRRSSGTCPTQWFSTFRCRAFLGTSQLGC